MNLRFETAGTLTPICSKTHLAFRFHLPQPSDELHIQFSYVPKRLEDPVTAEREIKTALHRDATEKQQQALIERWEEFFPLQNLITVSIDDPEGFRGSAHRHDPVQLHKLSETEASPGFTAGELPKGIWTVTLSVHCIVTPDCHYELKVWEGEGE
ncbi:hypothetical protein [Brevibacillus sp. NRS-1366]|uniref:hypothetical protein n=1 Tax=Brevibacillus sp. NRS-1366 TaxID=3233899 RepID=UPI003D239109